MSPVLLTVFLVHSVFACAPGPPTGPTSTSGVFQMSIQPPVRWTYPPKANERSGPQVASNQAEAQTQIHEDLLQAVNEILTANSLPVNTMKITVNPVDFVGSLVFLKDGKCEKTEKALVEPPKVNERAQTITQQCDGKENAAPTTYPAKSVTGSFDSSSGIGLTDNVWKEFTVQLQEKLTKLGAVFSENLVITPGGEKLSEA